MRHLIVRYLILTLLVPLQVAVAQVDFEHYSPRKKHSSDSEELVEALTENLQRDISSLEKTNVYQVVKRMNAARTRSIVNMVRDGAFIKDDSLETYVNNVLKYIIQANGIARESARVLILDSPEVNAYCFGHGTYVVSIGLLGRISSEDELAFTLAHEVAHDALAHIQKSMIREAEESLARRSIEQIRKILDGTIEITDIQEYRSLVYGTMRHNRAREIQSDSMGITLVQNAAFDQGAAFTMLTALAESLEPKFDIGADLVWPLHSREYPLQEGWFHKRLSIYSRGYSGSYLYSVDSLESHPDMELRKDHMSQYRRPDARAHAHQDRDFSEAVTLLAEFETVQSAFERGAYDRCLYYALQLLNRYPNNSFLTSRIGQVLIKLYESKSNNDNSFQRYVPHYTAKYSDELTLVNNMLHNLTVKELGEVTFHFLNNTERFNPEERSHYYLLWRISDLTYRRDAANDMKRQYKERFKGNVATAEIP